MLKLFKRCVHDVINSDFPSGVTEAVFLANKDNIIKRAKYLAMKRDPKLYEANYGS